MYPFLVGHIAWDINDVSHRSANLMQRDVTEEALASRGSPLLDKRITNSLSESNHADFDAVRSVQDYSKVI